MRAAAGILSPVGISALAPAPSKGGDRHALASTLTAYGVAALTTLSDPYVLAMYRLAMVEAPGDTELGEILDASGRQPTAAR